MKHPHKTKYSKIVRQFCLSLHFLSPRAYRLLRETFDKNLPHIVTIRKWYKNSQLNARSGVSYSSLETLKKVASKLKTSNKQLICSLSFDEMSIRTQIQWCRERKEFSGFVTYAKKKSKEFCEMDGGNVQLEEEYLTELRNEGNDVVENQGKNDTPIAKFALVFMVNGINEFIQLPVAYYFVNSSAALDKFNLVTHIVKEITKCGVKVSNVTFDGFSSNISMCSLLGADITNTDVSKIKPFFVNPIDNSKIYIIYDPSHMIKLIRNTFGEREVLYDEHGNKIEWKFVKKLYMYATEKKMTNSHKLSKDHIEYKKKKMKVSLATQVLSNSVADTMEKLMDAGYEDFRGK